MMLHNTEKTETRQWKCTCLIRRQNHNGEVVDRSRLCSSPSQTCVYCFNCRLMFPHTTKGAHFVIRKGIFEWKHALDRLRSHEHSMEHIDDTITCSRRQSWINYIKSVQL